LFSLGHWPTGFREEPVDKAKPFSIAKRAVWEAFKRVKANQGAAGVDGQSIADFEANLTGNLYELWNRMSSGSYFPPPVRRVDIPKANGGTRPLGIPTVADRIAQEVVRRFLEPILEPVFHADSYGYRPGKSAIDAVAKARERCWRSDWSSISTSRASSTTSTGSSCSRRSGVIRTARGCCSTSSAG
jgi:retron-type reverse transcriptase